MNTKAISASLVVLALLVPGELLAAKFETGVGKAPVGSRVADGVANGKARETHFKDTHYAIPEGREVGMYYASWGVYKGRDYAPHQVPVERLSHILVSFGGICGDNPGAFNDGAGLKTSCQSLTSSSDNAEYYLDTDKFGGEKLKRGQA